MLILPVDSKARKNIKILQTAVSALENNSVTWDFIHTKRSSGTTVYVTIIYDLASVLEELSGTITIQHKAKMYSSDPRINTVLAELYLTSSAVAGTLGTSQALTPPYISYGTYNIGVKQQLDALVSVEWSNPNNYRYLHVLLDIMVDDMVDFYNLYFREGTLIIGGHELTPISQFIPYLGIAGSYVSSESVDPSTKSKWAGKTFVTFGDSITAYDGGVFAATHIESGQSVKGYQTYMREILGCSILNKGSGGKTMPEIYAIINTHIYDGNAVTITSGGK